jgi:pimeloyl-ACP methyl ester carboxylesterase
VLPELARTNAVVAADLPGHGESELVAGDLDAAQVLAWLDQLIERTCPTPPVLVGYALGGAIAARLAAERPASIRRLVLIDALGLVDLAPSPEFRAAVEDFFAAPTRSTHGALWRYSAPDLDGLRARMGERWTAFEAYNVERARSAGQRAALGQLMREFGVSAIPPAELRRIAAPTDLIWGRQDLATPLPAAERAGELYRWPCT